MPNNAHPYDGEPSDLELDLEAFAHMFEYGAVKLPAEFLTSFFRELTEDGATLQPYDGDRDADWLMISVHQHGKSCMDRAAIEAMTCRLRLGLVQLRNLPGLQKLLKGQPLMCSTSFRTLAVARFAEGRYGGAPVLDLPHFEALYRVMDAK